MCTAEMLVRLDTGLLLLLANAQIYSLQHESCNASKWRCGWRVTWLCVSWAWWPPGESEEGGRGHAQHLPLGCCVTCAPGMSTQGGYACLPVTLPCQHPCHLLLHASCPGRQLAAAACPLAAVYAGMGSYCLALMHRQMVLVAEHDLMVVLGAAGTQIHQKIAVQQAVAEETLLPAQRQSVKALLGVSYCLSSCQPLYL